MATTTDTGLVPGESGQSGAGYGTGDAYINLSQLPLYVKSNDVTKKVWHPPTNAVPEIPAVPPTPTVINKIFSAGWNSSARSISKLELGSYFLFNAATGISGAVLGIGPEGLDGQPLSFFSHVLTCDRAGVHVYELGISVVTIKNRQYSTSMLRIYRQADGHIAFVVTTGSETLVYTSTVVYSRLYPTYIYGMLYSSGDQLLSAALNAGEVLYGAI